MSVSCWYVRLVDGHDYYVLDEPDAGRPWLEGIAAARPELEELEEKWPGRRVWVRPSAVVAYRTAVLDDWPTS